MPGGAEHTSRLPGLESKIHPGSIGLPVGLVVKNPPAIQETWGSTAEEILGGGTNPLQSILLKESRGPRNLAGYGPWGRKESDTLSTHSH